MLNFILGMVTAYSSLVIVPIMISVFKATLLTIGYIWGARKASKRHGDWSWTVWFKPVFYKWCFNEWWKNMTNYGRLTGCQYANGDRWEPFFKFYPKE